jgi:hypothetical protein
MNREQRHYERVRVAMTQCGAEYNAAQRIYENATQVAEKRFLAACEQSRLQMEREPND